MATVNRLWNTSSFSWFGKGFLLVSLCSFSFMLAIIIYLVLYFLLIPPTFYHMPLFFDFSSPYPVSTVKLPWKKLRYMSQLDGTLHICFPESPRNMQIGMLMFTLELLSANETVLYSRFRPTILRYKDDLETKMETLTYFFFLLFGWKKREQCQDLLLLQYKETNGDLFLRRTKDNLYLRIWINKENVEVYRSEFIIHAELRGFRYWMKRYKWTLSWIIGIGNLWFWMFAVVLFIVVLFIRRYRRN